MIFKKVPIIILLDYNKNYFMAYQKMTVDLSFWSFIEKHCVFDSTYDSKWK